MEADGESGRKGLSEVASVMGLPPGDLNVSKRKFLVK